MKNIMKIITLIMLITMLGANFTGCKKSDATQNYTAEGIKNIKVTTRGNNIVIRGTEVDEILLSLSDYSSRLATVFGDTIIIDIPMQKAGINLKYPEILYIDLPKSRLDTLQIESEVGDIELENVYVENISAKTQYGNIITKDVCATVEATTEMGCITSNVTMSDIIQNKNQYNGDIGDDYTNNILTIYTNTGNIKFQ